MLTKADCQVFEAENSTDAFELFANNRFNFVLTDIGLPDYSGLELAKKMRKFEIEKGREKTPILALSGHEFAEDLSTYEFKYGLAGVYTKPLRTEELTEILDCYGNDSKKRKTTKQSVSTKASHNNHLLDESLATKQLGSIEMVREMAQIMHDDALTNMIPEIDNYFQGQDWSKFKAKVHKFKSSCLYCATTPLLKLVERLEFLADSKEIKKIAPVYNEFTLCAEKTKKYIKAWLS